MSYARFGWDGSDVYVFLNVHGYLECCGCIFDFTYKAFSTQEMLDHLALHQERGHFVPADCIIELKSDRIENDGWILERKG